MMPPELCFIIFYLLISFGPEKCHLLPLTPLNDLTKQILDESKTTTYETFKSGVSSNLHQSNKIEETILDNITERSSVEGEMDAFLDETCEVYADEISFKNARNLFQSSFLPEDSTDRIMYIDVEFLNSSLNHLTSNERNSVKEWQWVLQKNLFFMQYPVDLDVVTYNIIAPTYTENFVSVTLNSPQLCNNTADLVEKVQELLWENIFQNHTNSYLCNRNFENDVDQKQFIYYLTMAWIGYDLDCSFFLDRTKQTSIKAKASEWLVLICFILALCYPLLYKVLEIRAMDRKISDIENKFQTQNVYEKSNESCVGILSQYTRNEVPFGFNRSILKIFYVYSPRCSDNINDIRRSAYKKFSIVVFLLLSCTSIYRFYKYEQNFFKQYTYVYRVGFPIVAMRKCTAANITVYFASLLFGMALLYKVAYLKCEQEKKEETDLRDFFCITDFENKNRSPEEGRIHMNDSKLLNNGRQNEFSKLRTHFTAVFIERFMTMISLRYWDATFGQCTFKFGFFFSCMSCPFRLLADIITSFFPFIWLIFFGAKVLTTTCLSNERKKIRKCLSYCILYLIFFVVFTWCQWVILTACINFIRTVVYIIFVALSSSVHLLRIFIVTVTTLVYLGGFLVDFKKKYEMILDKTFDIKSEIVKETQENIEYIYNKIDDSYVTEDEFNAVIDSSFHIREGVFWVTFKTFSCLCFFVISTIVLFKNNTFDDTKSDYIIKLAFMALTPKVLFECLEKKGNDVDIIMKQKQAEIKELIRKNYPQKNKKYSKSKAILLCCLCCHCNKEIRQFKSNLFKSISNAAFRNFDISKPRDGDENNSYTKNDTQVKQLSDDREDFFQSTNSTLVERNKLNRGFVESDDIFFEARSSLEESTKQNRGTRGAVV